MLEFLYVPVPALIRRKTKTFIDSFVDSAAEGLGAVFIYLWIVLAGGHSRYLSVLVILLSLVLFLLSRHAGRQYLGMIVRRLNDGDLEKKRAGQVDAIGIDPLTASFSRIDLHSLYLDRRNTKSGHLLPIAESVQELENESEAVSRKLPDIKSILLSSDNSQIIQILDSVKEWDPDHIPLLARLLARDDLQALVIRNLLHTGRMAVPHLVELLLDEDGDFVIRRRIPRALAGIGGRESEYALLQALSAGRFEIRYRAVIALVSLRKRGFCTPEDNLETIVWEAIRNEVCCSRPIWEIRRLIDALDPSEDDELVVKLVDARCSHSLEHTFRMLTLVLDPEPVTAALHGILIGDDEFKGFALEYLESTLPADIRVRLWPFIGDASEARKDKGVRPLKRVVSDLMSSRATLFQDAGDRDALKKMLGDPVE
jgi:hypothetical protein